MTDGGLSVELRHAARLCYAMQQSAVPWLHGLRLVNAGDAACTDLEVELRLPGFAAPSLLRVAAVPPRGHADLTLPDVPLLAEAFAGAVERAAVDLVVVVRRGGETLVEHRAPIAVLAYNEWPGRAAPPALLAAFVLPNHPALAPVLQAAAAALAARSGSAALDGYQSADPARVRAVVEAVHDAVRGLGIAYVEPPPSFEQEGQKVRTPEQVVGDRLATCLDLVLLYAALLEHAGVHPVLVLQRGHAFVGAWLSPTSAPEAELGPAVELRKRCDLGAMLAIECTLACVSTAQPLAAAVAAARRRLDDDAAFVTAIDVAAARRAGFRPLPARTHAFAPVPVPAAAAQVPPAAPPAAAAVAAEVAPSVVPAPAPPADRLELWRSKLLDLSLFNRLLNFVPTRKTVPLAAHDLAALEDRLQAGGRVRVHARPEVGRPDADPRDLDLAAARTGVDVRAEYLAAELRAGRLRAELDADELEDRLVEIFRHARTSLEESGANTLYLAIGFLHWYESRTADKPRRAPLLLLPLVVERLSVQDGFRFVLDDAEPRLNRTLLQLLQRDFDLRVPLGETPPEDERGVDVGAVLAAFRQAALAMPRWEVEASACIGFFSFTKYLMWLDLEQRTTLLQSPVLRHLVERPGTAFAQDAPEVAREQLDELDPAAVFCPKDADSSQLAAVLSAAGGRSFVLEGPPGTGKSQTITNLIAQALGQGQRVLFVAEKRAALEVVHRRLAEVGLGPFCLELHSSKSGPKAVLQQLAQALEIGQRREPAEWAGVARDLQAARGALNRLVHELHRPRQHGLSVFAAMGELVRRRQAGRVPLPELPVDDAAAVAAAEQAVQALAAAAGPLGVPAAAPWWGVRRTDWTPALPRSLGPLLERLQQANDAHAAAATAVAAALGFDAAAAPPGVGRDQLDALQGLARRLQAPSLPPSAWLLADWRGLDRTLREAIALGTARDAAWSPLAARWRRELLDLDLDRLAAACTDAAAAFVLLRWWRLRRPRAELRRFATAPLGDARALAADLQAALRVRADERALLALAPAAQALGPAWRAGQADWAQVEAWRQWLDDVHALLLRLHPGALAPPVGGLEALARVLDRLVTGDSALPRLLGALLAAHDEAESAHAAVRTALDLDVDAAFGPAAAPGWPGAVAARVRRWREHLPALRDHCAYAAAAAAAAAAGLAPLVEAQARGAVPADGDGGLHATFRATVLEAWLDRLHAHEPELARFRGLDHERAIARFAELDRQAIRLAGDVVVARLAAQVPSVRATHVASSELGVLERELKKQRRHKPVRRLLAELPGLLPRLAPCLLMSPLSVAQFLARGGPRFDLVVFDEASQIPMWDAVGAIGRGRSLVVVGDSRQLPPTTFFQRLAQGDDLGDDELPEDLESVLDECGAAGLPRLHLDWHYRSRHESLIAFSNHHYYQNRLLTFPAPHATAPGIGVRCVRTAGVYDRAGSQQNRVEAEALVGDVLARLCDPARAQQSLGVVTFSQAQQTLIEDLLDAARRERPEIEAAFAAAAEPVFVKNLENVQGDERDVILFSIGYGPDAQGRVYEHYGPLNLQGGERRLNVAVTRARRELVVFTSVGPEQVANRSGSLGARHLRAFLDYALRGAAALHAAAAGDPGSGVESPFEAAVRDALAQRGHEVHTQVGCSGYRIDLAVVDPEAPGRYLLGIECDGATYHAAATARDRDRLRAAVLRGLGWRLCRVWSTDFWQDPAGEVARLERAIVAAKAAAPPPPAAPAPEPGPAVATTVPPAPEPAPPADADGPRPYTPAALAPAGTAEQFQAAAALRPLRAQVQAVLAAEAPVTFDRLARTIAATWQLTRVTDRVRERVREALPPAAVDAGGVLWPDAARRDAFRGFRVPGEVAGAARDADELPPAEIANAMRWLLRQHGALAADDLAREAARCFGITRLGAQVREVMVGVEARLVADGQAVRDGDLLRLP